MGALTELQKIPGVGASLSQDLFDLGYRSVDELTGKIPEEIYHDLVVLRDKPLDRCVLYVLRGAVYYASNSVYQPELLKWWNWKDDEFSVPYFNKQASIHKRMFQKGTAQKGTAQKGTAQKGTAQKGTAQKGTAQKGTAQKDTRHV